MGRHRARAVRDQAAARRPRRRRASTISRHSSGWCKQPRPTLARVSDRAAGWRGRTAVRRDDGAGVDGRGSAETAALRGAVRMEGPRDAQGRAAAVRAADTRLADALRTRGICADRGCYVDDDGPAADAEGRPGDHAAGRHAGRTCKQGVHILRHTFCSHLAMQGRRRGPSRNSPDTRTGDDAAVHALSPAALEAAIRLLDAGEPRPLVEPTGRRRELELKSRNCREK